MTKQITAAEIHKDFYGAEERLLAEAEALKNYDQREDSVKALRYAKVGFTKSKTVSDHEARTVKIPRSLNMISAISYFRQNYPGNKFITSDEVKVLCKKYGLLLGEARNYIGDMPDKNLVEIENFKLKKEDFKEKIRHVFINDIEPIRYRAITERLVFNHPHRSGQDQMSDRLMAKYMAMMLFASSNATEKSKETEQPAFKICAPAEDFNTAGYEIHDDHKLVYDPIVLQPVGKDGIDGFLIVTAWGDEASDALVVNDIMN